MIEELYNVCSISQASGNDTYIQLHPLVVLLVPNMSQDRDHSWESQSSEGGENFVYLCPMNSLYLEHVHSVVFVFQVQVEYNIP